MGSCCCPMGRTQDYDELEELLTVKEMTLRILTWNVAAEQPTNKSVKRLLQQSGQHADILVIGLQEIIDINSAKNMLIDDDTASKWENIILKRLNAVDYEKYISSKSKAEYNDMKYIQLCSVRMMGVLMLVYVKSKFKKKIHGIWRNKIGAGLFNVAPNKGGVGIRFDIFNTWFCFICAHLAAHQEKVKDRDENYHKIMNELTFYDDEKNETIDISSHDLIFFFGDLNYRLNFEEDELENVYSLINEKKYAQLLSRDQLLSSRQQKTAFDGFLEKEITFAPTYKYEIGSSEISKTKKRIPSYCDRILWKVDSKDHNIECLKYDAISAECMSDHKPVMGSFKVKLDHYYPFPT